MRPSLLHPLREPRRARRRPVRRTRGATAAAELPHRQRDPAVERVREAGGPIDRASYSCACGYLFSASVSTSVSCPHCGAEQAW
jgi:rubrerythrin